MLIAGILLAVGYVMVTRDRSADRVQAIEKTLSKENCALLPLSLEVARGISTIRYALPETTSEAGFYLRHVTSGRGTLLRSAGGGIGPGSLHVYPTLIVQQVSSNGPVRVVAESDGWELFEVVPEGSEPVASQTRIHEFEMADGFMRSSLAKGDGWRVLNGEWNLNKYGGGIPKTAAEAVDSNFQRAANPFTVIARSTDGKEAVMVYDTTSSKGESYFAEGRFLMGSPSVKRLRRDKRTGKTTSQFLIAQGNLDGPQLAFGWWPDDSGSSCWRMCYRRGQGAWRILRSWVNRPPLGTWARVGIGVNHGHRAFAMLDGQKLGSVKLNVIVSGPLHIHIGGDGVTAEFDDIKAGPFSVRGGAIGTPVFVPSRNFATKRGETRRDPVQFDQWARGLNAYEIAGDRATTRMSLFSDFTYRSTPSLPEGTYTFTLLRGLDPRDPSRQAVELAFRKTAAGWQIPRDDKPGTAFSLELGRRGSSIVVRDGSEFRTIGQCSGPVHLRITQPLGTSFKPEAHSLSSTRMWHEMFEKAPSDWYWHGGAFGMNLRWACRPGWNFMAGKSPHLCALLSKHAYVGDQEIDCYMALPAVIPQSRGFYIRRDLCLSFCSDGQNLDSGYALIFGSEHNTKTVLKKKGRIIAATTDPKFLFPLKKGRQLYDVHWFWWNFRIRKTRQKIVVMLNGKEMFEVYDPKPIPDGHLAFWTVRNGLVLSRVTVAAEDRVPRPEVGITEPSNEGLLWRPPYEDSVVLSAEGSMTKVKNHSGGGTFAVRTSSTVDLSKKPVLEIPFRSDDEAKVNLHIGIGGRSYLAMVSAPITETPFLISGVAPENDYEIVRLTGGELSAVYLGAARVMDGKLTLDLGEALEKKGIQPEGETEILLTLGNTSNEKYLMAGFFGNHAGTRYWLGRPRWLASGTTR
ncbi:MAG: hypothetical protein QGH15_06805 [Kiritimatiellia bacterium]|jgi:hypothetical protein|nr:hypothetical protein [Kiritimatiellia bacterium]